MNLVKSFILALLAVSSVNANIRGTRRILTTDNEEASFVAIGSSSDTCRINRDCPSNHICRFRGREARRTCVRRNGGSSSSVDTNTCRRNNDCDDNQRCNDAGKCVRDNRKVPRSGQRCTRNGECGAHRICGDNGHCQRRDMEFDVAMEQY